MTQAPQFESIEHVYSAFSELADREVAHRVEEPEFEIDVYDREYRHLGECGDYLDATVQFAANRIAPGVIELPGDSEWGPYFRRCKREVIPVTVKVRGRRWSGRAESCERHYDAENGLVWRVTLISDWAWLRSILAWPSPFAPIQAQFPKHDIAIGPARTVLKGYLIKNLIRLQQPLWGIINNFTIGGLVSGLGGMFGRGYRPVDFQNYDPQKPNDPLDPMEWQRGVQNRANHPVAVKPHNPFTDTSTWVALTARMTPMDELFEDVLRDEGLLLTADVWLPGDPPVEGLVLTKPTIVIDIVDKTYAVGPNGNILTGLFRAVTRVLEDGITKVIVPVDMPTKTGPLAANEPWIVIDEDDEESGVISSTITSHHPLAKYCVIGGRSPAWLNQGINLLIESALSAILSFVGQSGISSTLLNGILDDVFMAWDRYYDANRVRELGPYGFHEHFSAGGSVALSFSGLMNGRAALRETRGFESYEFEIEDGAPYAAGEDFWLKDPIGVKVPGPSPEGGVDQIYLQYVELIEFTDSRAGRVVTKVSIGDPHAGEDPVDRAMRKVKQLTSFLNALFLNTD
ncbi:hypothetical protein [Hoyosella altamirensis]|uniref:Gp28/Gp37-like domain-containing protein n=1 Tax=Hoyosella altamirensis TaxID=616997 RepID=A0A839RVV8_9ACTN|nr:hypothetical protein [Hoyosella altamirensis]MBB3040154.1 hypothetical protein [Hoyosella altamirensis]